MKHIKISVSEFALPSPLTGSLEIHSGLGGTIEEGIDLHRLVQTARKEEHLAYQSEVRISQDFDFEGHLFTVEGRMDGLLRGEVPLIEEIKSTFNIWELAKQLKQKKDTHPYCLQLLTYGYMYWLETGVNPALNLHLISTRNQESIDIELELDLKIYKAWLKRRLEELYKQAIRSEKRVKRRKDLSPRLTFPFERPRTGQVELIESIEQGLAKKQILMLQAPTGLGKTVGVLWPSLKEALNRGQRVVYVTPKNSQHQVAEEVVDKFEEKGCSVKSLTLTAKSKMCFKAEPLCNPEYCEFAKDYYDKLAQNDLKSVLAKKRKLTARVFKNLGEKFQVCPFELQLEASEEADVVICDYNYVFGNKSSMGNLKRTYHTQEGLPNLVVDEAHNLPSRGMSYFSPSLSCHVLDKFKEEVKQLPKKFVKEGQDLLNDLIHVVAKHVPEGAQRPVHVQLALEPFLEQDEQLRQFLSKYLESEVEIKTRDPVLRIFFYWNEFTDVLKQVIGLKRPEFFFTYHPDFFGGTVKITCCDPSFMLKDKYQDFEQVILFSATLRPFDFYLSLSGLKDLKVKTAEFSSPFDQTHRKLLIIPQVSTKFSERHRNFDKIADVIQKISSVKQGNYLAFFPSFEFMEQVYTRFNAPTGFEVIKQTKNLKSQEVELILVTLKVPNAPKVIFAVQGGVLSEGVDYPGEMLIGAFIIGPPLPSFDVERESMKKFYAQTYQEGFEYAYAYPAMARAVQAAGRVIRTETDKGIIVLMDDRFLEKNYSKSMPTDWFKENPRELVSHSILKDVQEFWGT